MRLTVASHCAASLLRHSWKRIRQSADIRPSHSLAPQSTGLLCSGAASPRPILRCGLAGTTGPLPGSAPNTPSGRGPGGHATFEGKLPVDYDETHASAELMRLLVRSMVLDSVRIEHDNVSEIT